MDSCKDIARLISEGMDRELHWTARMCIRVHLMMCKGCTNFQKQMRVLRAASKAYADRYSPTTIENRINNCQRHDG